MAYLELSFEGYENLIKAAGNRGAQISKVCREQGTWEDAASEEDPARDERQTDLDLPAADADATAMVDTAVADTESDDVSDS